MPEAAWCSACQKYVWVSPEGECQFGHGAEYLSARFVDGADRAQFDESTPEAASPPFARIPAARPAQPPRAVVTRTRVVVVVALMIALIGGLAFAAFATFRSAWKAAAPQAILPQGQRDARANRSGGSAEPTLPATQTPASEPASFTPMTTTEWDAFIAEQYPGYRIKQRIKVPDQFKKGLLGMNYVLLNKRRQGFTLLVSLAQLRPDQTVDDAPEAYFAFVGQVATNDALFSAHAKRETEYLGAQAQDAIIDGYLENRPSPTAVAFGGFGDEGTTTFQVAIGPEAVARAVKSHEGFDYIAETTIPSGPHNKNVSVTVSPF